MSIGNSLINILTSKKDDGYFSAKKASALDTTADIKADEKAKFKLSDREASLELRSKTRISRKEAGNVSEAAKNERYIDALRRKQNAENKRAEQAESKKPRPADSKESYADVEDCVAPPADDYTTGWEPVKPDKAADDVTGKQARLVWLQELGFTFPTARGGIPISPNGVSETPIVSGIPISPDGISEPPIFSGIPISPDGISETPILSGILISPDGVSEPPIVSGIPSTPDGVGTLLAVDEVEILDRPMPLTEIPVTDVEDGPMFVPLEIPGIFSNTGSPLVSITKDNPWQSPDIFNTTMLPFISPDTPQLASDVVEDVLGHLPRSAVDAELAIMNGGLTQVTPGTSPLTAQIGDDGSIVVSHAPLKGAIHAQDFNTPDATQADKLPGILTGKHDAVLPGIQVAPVEAANENDLGNAQTKTEQSVSAVDRADGLKTAAGVSKAAQVDAAKPLSYVPVTEQVVAHIRKGFGAGEKHISIQLDPRDMGRIEIRMEIAGDKNTYISVIAEHKETLDLLQRDQRFLERALQDAGLKADSNSLNFSLRDQGQQQAEQQALPKHAFKNPLVLEDELSLILPIEGETRYASQYGLDIRV